MTYEEWYDKYEDTLSIEYQRLVDAGLRDSSEKDWESWREEQWKAWKASVFE